MFFILLKEAVNSILCSFDNNSRRERIFYALSLYLFVSVDKRDTEKNPHKTVNLLRAGKCPTFCKHLWSGCIFYSAWHTIKQIVDRSQQGGMNRHCFRIKQRLTFNLYTITNRTILSRYLSDFVKALRNNRSGMAWVLNTRVKTLGESRTPSTIFPHSYETCQLYGWFRYGNPVYRFMPITVVVHIWYTLLGCSIWYVILNVTWDTIYVCRSGPR